MAEIAGGYVALNASDSIERSGGRGGMAAGVVTVGMWLPSATLRRSLNII
jgi:hypothetical protein